jgi:hypothetical protein
LKRKAISNLNDQEKLPDFQWEPLPVDFKSNFIKRSNTFAFEKQKPKKRLEVSKSFEITSNRIDFTILQADILEVHQKFTHLEKKVNHLGKIADPKRIKLVKIFFFIIQIIFFYLLFEILSNINHYFT